MSDKIDSDSLFTLDCVLELVEIGIQLDIVQIGKCLPNNRLLSHNNMNWMAVFTDARLFYKDRVFSSLSFVSIWMLFLTGSTWHLFIFKYGNMKSLLSYVICLLRDGDRIYP